MVPIVSFNLLYVLVIVRLARRELVWIHVTAHPTAERIAQQITEALPWNEIPRYHPAIGTGPTVLLSRVAVVLLAASFPGQPEAQLRALVHRYIEEATTREWSMMAEQTATRK